LPWPSPTALTNSWDGIETPVTLHIKAEFGGEGNVSQVNIQV